MNKNVLGVLAALVVVQIILVILKIAALIPLRWLWVLTPCWLLVSIAALYGIYCVVRRNKNIRG